MKLKFLLVPAFLFLATFAHADDRARVGTSDASLSIQSWAAPAWSSATAITVASSTYKNCLSDLTVLSTNTFTFRILNEGTTAYQLTGATASPHTKTWGTNTPFCGAAAQRLFFSISCTGCTPDINYQLFLAQ